MKGWTIVHAHKINKDIVCRIIFYFNHCYYPYYSNRIYRIVYYSQLT
jgi:hypothetical protein